MMEVIYLLRPEWLKIMPVVMYSLMLEWME
jgi:hypothetical protein